jgi:hypothetical protein
VLLGMSNMGKLEIRTYSGFDICGCGTVLSQGLAKDRGEFEVDCMVTFLTSSGL